MSKGDPFDPVEAQEALAKQAARKSAAEAAQTGVAVADLEYTEPQLIAGDIEGAGQVDWPEGIKRLMVQNWITAEDLGFLERNKANIVTDAKRGEAKAIKTLDIVMNVLLECMKNDTHQRHKTNERNQPLYYDENNKITTDSRAKDRRDMDGKIIKYRPVNEIRSKHGVMRGRECGSGPGTRWNRPGEWKLRVQEHFHELFPQLSYREHKPAFPAGQFGAVPGAADYARQKHAEGMGESGMERAATLEWLHKFLKNPVCTWGGEV
jgi:hypothetical protein